MKKILIILMMFLAFASLNSAKLKLTAINARCINGNWEGWRSCDIDADWDVENQSMIIYSKTPQEFNKIYFEGNSYKDSAVLVSRSKDKNNFDVVITLYLYKSTQRIKFSYPAGEYMYVIE